MMKIKIVLLLVCIIHSTFGCDIIVKNVGQRPFTWHISYAGSNDYENDLAPQEHDNYNCSCLPHDMEIRLPDGFYCYHYMNCINGNEYMVEVTDYAVYISVGRDVVDMCIL